ncbi:uncharacterized protein LOC121379206 isoform X2 [Gigantopelta aegis]|uniref:uncharacterized protein LOC121379206 isoform X2 n=1 Tax=Gigantopelta aegis TaxID=1735272 RepID=UPI001B88E3AB|nr:uncharacterized protein LOC121379206 isoform X2 [Gigantopelta aegis]
MTWSAIQCYVCNSHLNGTACYNIDSQSEEKRKSYAFDCDKLGLNPPPTMCRKLRQEYGKEEVRIIRGCSVTYPSKCVQGSTADNSGRYFKYCHCKDPLCNSSSRNGGTMLAILIALLPVMKYCCLNL